MLTPDDRAALKRDRQAFRDYVAGGCEGTFVLPRRDAYPVGRAMLHGPLAYVRFALNYLLTRAAQMMPLCAVKNGLYRWAGVRIGRGVFIAPGVVIDPLFPRLVELGDDCCLGIGSSVLAHEYTATEFRIARVRVGEGSVIGVNSTVRCGVTVGAGVTVGTMSFVNRDVPDGQTVGGVPAVSLPPAGEGAP